MHLIAKDPAELARMKSEQSEYPFLHQLAGIDGMIMLYPTVLTQFNEHIQKFRENKIGLLDLVLWMIENDMIIFKFGCNWCSYNLHELFAISEKCEQSAFWNTDAQRRVVRGWLKKELISKGEHVN